MLKADKKWLVPKLSKKNIERLTKELDLPYLAAVVLASKGMTEPEKAKAFINTDLNNLIPSKTLLNIQEAVKRILEAVFKKQRIYIHMDYDADGLTSGAAIYSFLKMLGVEVDWGVSNRFKNGYGFYRDYVDKAASAEAELIITVDCGTTDTEAVAYAKEFHGIDVIILDHHLPQTALAPASAIVNPRQENCPYPFKELAAVGVVFKTVLQIATELNIDQKEIYKLLDFVAVGTIGDVVPLYNENRILVKNGINILHSSQRPCWLALGEVTNISHSNWTEDDIGFTIAPILNAAGRLADPSLSFKLLTAKNLNEARQIARKLKSLNEERKNLTTTYSSAAEQTIKNIHWQEERVIIASGSNWHKGLLGLIAANLRETFHRPAIALSEENDIFTGSARSISDFNLIEALSYNAHLLESYGGHKMAAGLTLKRKNLEAFKKGLLDYAKQYSEEIFIPTLPLTATTTLETLLADKAETLKILSPFGNGNSKPLFYIPKVEVVTWQSFGSENKHHRLTLKSNNCEINAVAFQKPGIPPSLPKEKPILDLVASPEVNVYRGHYDYRLKISDWCQIA